MLKREAEWFHLAHPLRQELSELRSFKQQVQLWVSSNQSEDLPSFLKFMPVDEWLEEALLGSQVSTLPVEAVPENPFV
jgi:hypothetical protein